MRHHRADSRRRRGIHEPRDAVSRLRAVCLTQSGGTYMRAEPALVKDLVWAGFDMVSRANNHTGDYGVARHEPDDEVRGRGRAGAGGRRPEPRRSARSQVSRDAEGPRGADLGRVHVPRLSRAGRTRGDMPARPGLNPLRFTTTTTVTAERLAELRAASSGDQRPPRPATG